ncbi:transposase [Janthinobacterium sp. NFX145]|uniref:transposase n=1 Tax=Janthinobacterium sp. NFX145 TaxID=3415602 RepID=UPI003CC590A5
MMKPRISLFAEHEREHRRTKIGDPLVGLNKHVDFETALTVKILVLQQLYNLADDALEYQLLDRRSFLQFLDLTESSSIPDAKTIWLFHDRLAQAGVSNQIFEQLQRQLQLHCYMARCEMGGKLVRCLDIVRVTFALHLKSASDNLKRLVFLMEGGLAPF